MTDWNTLFNRVRMSHRMNRADVAECCQLGGMEISNSRAEGWARGASDARRHVIMTADDFEAFTAGLPEWAKQHYQDG